MKLARINHERCNEWNCSTYVWIPDDWTEEHFQIIVSQAKQEYLAHRAKVKEENPPLHPYGYNLEGLRSKYPEEFPDTMTFAEADIKVQEFRQRKKEYDAKISKLDRGLLAFLEDKGVKSFYSYSEGIVPTAWCDWGHNHGQNYDYEDTKIETSYPKEKSYGDDW